MPALASRANARTGGELLIGREQQLGVSSIRIDTPQQACVGAHLQFVGEAMPRECGVIGFDIKLKIFRQIIVHKSGIRWAGGIPLFCEAWG